MRRTAIIALSLAVVAGALAWWFSPGQVVERRIHELFATISNPKKPDALRRALRVSTLGGQIAAQVTLDTPDPRATGTFQRDEILNGFAVMLESHTATFTDIQIETLEATSDQAVATVHFRASVASPSRTLLTGPSTATLTLTRHDDRWLLSSISIHADP